jgi:hypothetical protein
VENSDPVREKQRNSKLRFVWRYLFAYAIAYKVAEFGQCDFRVGRWNTANVSGSCLRSLGPAVPFRYQLESPVSVRVSDAENNVVYNMSMTAR